MPVMSAMQANPAQHGGKLDPQGAASVAQIELWQVPLTHASPGAQHTPLQNWGCPTGAAEPHSKQIPPPCIAALVHSPRLRPGGKACRQKSSQAELPVPAPSAIPP